VRRAVHVMVCSQVGELQLKDVVAFLPSFSDAQRSALLTAAAVVVYTPQHEHFGIVPIEAMAAGKPVVACRSGGPVESIADGETGLLCDPTPDAFAAALQQLLKGGAVEAARMGKAARARVEAMFSRPAFGSTLDGYVRDLAAGNRVPAGGKKKN
jgi:alpha-1,3/alpha-1,6-mannosyltransferase